MSLTALIAQTDSSFKLSQKLVQSLAEKFAFKFEDGWAVVSSRSIENVQKRLKRERRRNNPLSSVKKPRTAFSFFTQAHRPVVQKANTNATFGELSRLVSADWKNLAAADMATYKAMETADKTRYQGERENVQAAATAAALAAPVDAITPVVVAVTTEAPKKVKVAKAVTPVVAATPAADIPAVAATPAAKPTKAKATSAKKTDASAVPVAAPVATVVAAVVAPVETKPKAAKKDVAAAAATPAAAPAAAPAAPAAKAVKKASK